MIDDLEVILSEGESYTIEFKESPDISEGRIRDLLRDMVSDGTIEKVGRNRYTYYVLK